MRIYLTDQAARFPVHLEELRGRPILPYDPSALKETVTTCDLGAAAVRDKAEQAIFSYRIFPPEIMKAYTEWDHHGRTMEPGDTIVQQVHLPPWPRFSQKVVFAVRVKEVFREPRRVGFSYETLTGHVEKGISTFLLEENEGRLQFTVHTRSGPGNLLTALVGPVFSRPYQAYCTRRALAHVKALCA